jgi:hypothetical protein
MRSQKAEMQCLPTGTHSLLLLLLPTGGPAAPGAGGFDHGQGSHIGD